MSFYSKVIRYSPVMFGAALVSGLVVMALYFYLNSELPSTENLKDVHFQVPLRVYSHDGKLLAEYGEMKRTPVKYKDVPDLMIKAVLAAEDDRFFRHHGVDYQGILRAAWVIVSTGEKSQGGSTITMQVARNFFLGREKTFLRKFTEILLSFKIERELTKEEILELYLNKIYLGNRAYGVAAAAQSYYGVELNQLSVAQIAMIAGLPKAPSKFNPVVNSERALERRNYVLRRMHELKFIDDIVFQRALAEKDTAALHAISVDIEAPYLGEMVRTAMVDQFGEDEAYTAGYRVYTTVDSRLQQAANHAVHDGLVDYETRHGYRGPERHIDKTGNTPVEWAEHLQGIPVVGGLMPALVIGVEDRSAKVYQQDGRIIALNWDGMAWAGANAAGAADILKVGDVIRVDALPNGNSRLAQIPQVGGALVSLQPQTGAVMALVGGFDFDQSKFNRVAQAERQPGSSFKPFIYSAALEKGFTPASIINDAPLVFEDAGLEGAWRPENYSGEFYGPTRLREALVHSRNLVSIRLLQAIGVDYAIDYASRFGFTKQALPRNLSLALGSGTVSPLTLAGGYAAFANGGYRVTPYYIERITDIKGNMILDTRPAAICDECADMQSAPPVKMTYVAADGTAVAGEPKALLRGALSRPAAPRIISAQNVYLMTSMMRDVIARGTGRRAMQLGRHDLAGKTGTTNEQRDAWFSGFNPDVVTTSWMGFDDVRPLGESETGGYAALPMWMDYMTVALQGVPEKSLPRPPGLVSMRIDPETGLLAGSGNANAIFETFVEGNIPAQGAASSSRKGAAGSSKEQRGIPEQLF